MSSDQHFPATLDHILSGVRAQLEGELRAYAEQASRAASADLEQAVAQAARAAAEERDRAIAETLRAAAEERQRAIEVAAADVRRQADEQIHAVRSSADAQFHELRRAREAADATIHELQREREAAESQLRDLRRSTDARVAEIATERDRLRLELGAVQRQLQDLERRELDKREQDERAAAARTRTHLAPAIRAIDASVSLGDVLERLTESAMLHCDRAALLMLREQHLRAWRVLGFDEGDGDLRNELPVDAAGIAGTAAREGRVLAHAGVASAQLPRFAASSDVGDASAFPVTIAGAVVAVLYADVADERPPDSTWVADLEVLTRHASRMLEAITMQQALGLRPTGVARPSQAAPSAAFTRAPADASGPRGLPRGLS